MNKRGYTSYLIKAIMLLLALIIMVVVATVAWFVSEDHPVTAEGLSVNTKTSSQFQVAIGFSNYSTDNKYVMSGFEHEFDLANLKASKVDEKGNMISDTAQIYNVFSDFTALDVTGNGIKLVRPNLAGKNSYIDTDPSSYGYGDVKANENYISFDMYIKSSDPCALYLNDGSKAIAVGENDKNQITQRDAMVGALRVAFIDYHDYEKYAIGSQKITAEAPNAMWIPRPDIRYDDVTDKENPTFYTGIKNSGDENASYNFLTGYTSTNVNGNNISEPTYTTFNTYKHHYFSYETDSSGNITGGSYKTYGDTDIAETNDVAFTTIAGDLSRHDRICVVDTPIAEKDPETGEDADEIYYYGKMHVNIWLEGCDSEARRILRGGKFTITFDLQCDYNLDGTAPTEDNTINDNTGE